MSEHATNVAVLELELEEEEETLLQETQAESGQPSSFLFLSHRSPRLQQSSTTQQHNERHGPRRFPWSRRLFSRVLLLFVMALLVWWFIGKEEKKALQEQQEDVDVRPIVVQNKTTAPIESPSHAPTITSTTTTTQPEPSWHSAMRPLSRRAQEQIANYRNGTGLLLNLHIVHHGGTAFCSAIGKSPDANGTVPSFACMGQRMNNVSDNYYPRDNPWLVHKTAHNIDIVRRQYNFHMISWGFSQPPIPAIRLTGWEDPNLLSVMIMRHPMRRMLAGDGIISKKYPGLLTGEGTREQWEMFTNSSFTDNFCLRILAGHGCCAGSQTLDRHLRAAQELVQRFSIVLDIDCLNQNLEAMADLLGLKRLGKLRSPKERASPRERIGHDDIYNYLVEKNKMDIALYEWSKSLSLLDCSKL